MAELYTVRVLSPDGTYPSSSIFAEEFAILGVDDFVWSVVHAPENEDMYPEGAISWFTLNEIRFFAALSLAEKDPEEHGMLRILSLSWPEQLAFKEADGSVEPSALFERSRQIAAKLRAEPRRRGPWIPHVSEEPGFVERDYTQEVHDLIRAIEVDRLLHRGLYKLLMAAELRRFPQFLEESALAAFISREAALELLRRKLSDQSGTRLKKDDILEHIRETFPLGEPFVEVLEMDWEARILMVHPISEFGEYWSPPVHADECYEALTNLVHLYRYLLLNEVWVPEDP